MDRVPLPRLQLEKSKSNADRLRPQTNSCTHRGLPQPPCCAARTPLPETALRGTAGRWICRAGHVQLQQELPLSTGHSSPPGATPKDRPAPGCATVKARRSCCSEKRVCPRQTAAGHCFSMSQTSGNAPVPSCFAVCRFPPTFRMCRRAPGCFPSAVLLLLRFPQASVLRARVRSAAAEHRAVPARAWKAQPAASQPTGSWQEHHCHPENRASSTTYTSLHPFTSSDGPSR